jgi:hypothetical protein
MKREPKPIRPEFGLEGLIRKKVYGFSFDRSFLKLQCDEVRKTLSELIKFTKVPGRSKKFRLKIERTKEVPKPIERRLEKAIWSAANKNPSVIQLGSTCAEIHTYQFPLTRHKGTMSTAEVEAINEGWEGSKIDLLGVDGDGFPVVFELKKTGRGSSNPLHMVVEAALYGVAVKQMWPDILPEWKQAFGDNVPLAPLKTCRLIGIAPHEYWEQWHGDKSQHSLWEPLKLLCLLLAQHGLPVSFASFTHGELDGPLPEIRDLRPIPLPD